MSKFWLFQDSKYAQFLHMRGLHKILNMPQYDWIMPEWTVLTMAGFWICLIKVSQGFEYASDSKCARAWNMARLWICEGSTGCWIYLNIDEYSLIMPQYILMSLNNAKYTWIYLNIPESWIHQNFECVWCIAPNVGEVSEKT